MIDGFTSILIQVYGIGLIVFTISFITSKNFRKSVFNSSKEIKGVILLVYVFAAFLLYIISL